MIKVNFFHVCETAVIEKDTNKISIIGIFENIQTTSFPATQPHMAVVVGFEAEKPGFYDIEVVFSDKDGELGKSQGKISVGDNLMGNYVTKIPLYPIRSETRQNIVVTHEGKTIYTGHLTVNGK